MQILIRTLPADMDLKHQSLIVHPLLNDVLLGRGRPLQTHSGNIRLHSICNKYREVYKTAQRREKVSTNMFSCSTPMVVFALPITDPFQHYCCIFQIEIAAKVLAEVSTPDYSDELTKRGEKLNTIRANRKESNEDDVYRGGRVLRRTDSGRHWVEVSTAIALEKVSHTLRGLPRQSKRGDAPNKWSSCSSKNSVSSSSKGTMLGKRKGLAISNSVSQKKIEAPPTEKKSN